MKDPSVAIGCRDGTARHCRQSSKWISNRCVLQDQRKTVSSLSFAWIEQGALLVEMLVCLLLRICCSHGAAGKGRNSNPSYGEDTSTNLGSKKKRILEAFWLPLTGAPSSPWISLLGKWLAHVVMWVSQVVPVNSGRSQPIQQTYTELFGTCGSPGLCLLLHRNSKCLQQRVA